MKAREYADIYTNAEDKLSAVKDIATKFLIETAEISRQRKVQTDAAGLAVLREQADKWKAMGRLLPGVFKEDGFMSLVKAEFPEISALL